MLGCEKPAPGRERPILSEAALCWCSFAAPFMDSFISNIGMMTLLSSGARPDRVINIVYARTTSPINVVLSLSTYSFVILSVFSGENYTASAESPFDLLIATDTAFTNIPFPVLGNTGSYGATISLSSSKALTLYFPNLGESSPQHYNALFATLLCYV